MKGVGLCATFSEQGDWAFDYALWLARKTRTRLNIFHCLESPFTIRRDVVFIDGEKRRTADLTPELIAEKDRELRFAYDDRLGGYPHVGFRICQGSTEWELKRCFRRGDYEVLVIPYQTGGATFGGTTTIEKFASRFRGPVVLVGPDRPGQYFLNDPAVQTVPTLNIPPDNWEPLAV